ncbi:NADH dehydrogenase FAD-containing subunit [Bacillus pakistanensis]|uniref:NADH dehydrogenase FAD-containing subunit n=1 Tax=Rossellomorea pakistanensis TaxID=992288 RepID=A0ABS2NJK1_9BACI|nr:FAD-dependent oxidoreductase [Bacillus pakistanensis]MBM7588043.1 NADH dehydrogenase FAD-containing subunit [Bacillus pakistanensis]
MKTVVLVGGGHSHLYCLKQLQKERHSDMNWVLVSNSKYQYYSDMFAGYTEGIYSDEDCRVNLEQLCERSKVSFVQGTVLSIDPHQQVILTDQGHIQRYDIISFNIGSKNTTDFVDGLDQNNERTRLSHLVPEKIDVIREGENPVIIGNGFKGLEFGLSLLAWKKNQQKEKPNVTIIHSAPLEARSIGFEKMSMLVQEKSGSLIASKPKSIDDAFIYTEDGRRIPFSHLIDIGEPSAPKIFQSSPLKVDDKGFLLTHPTLQSVSKENVFGVGSCTSIKKGSETSKGHGIKQGPFLWENIHHLIGGKSLTPYKPRTYRFSIMSTGGKKGLLTYGRYSSYGKWQWKLKNLLNRRYIAKYK